MNKGKSIKQPKQLKADSSWRQDKEARVFKPKAKTRPPKEHGDCTGPTCTGKDSVFKNKAPKGGECS